MPKLHALLKRARRAPSAQQADIQQKLQAFYAQSQAAYQARRAALPVPDFPEDLPVNQKRDDIASAILNHPVLVVCGETGSGKTTQLPKICLSLGRGAAGLIGHTQPRRIAARSTASRIAQELGSPFGQAVGYKIRFHDRVSPNSAIKLMTDGILLAETQGDPGLYAYDTIIIDEAHERSTNIDFLLGYLKQLLPRRPDLKVIVTSATLDAARFAEYFAQAGQPAPVIEVSGRLHPIEIRYRPVLVEGETPAATQNAASDSRAKERDIYDALLDAVDETHRSGPGDALVFLPGEREIREASEVLRKAHHASHMEIVPLFARQSAQEQARIFAPSQGRRIVLATNVAETSLTVPGIRYVIDTGLARIKRYSYRNKVEQLQIEKIARANAQQRAGRCGRVAAGICIRLYDEADFNQRSAHTEPELLRSSLAGVILRMHALGLGEVENFPFLDLPTSRMIGDGYQLLEELGALTDNAQSQKQLTPLGRELAKLPLDPKIGRMLLAGRDYACLSEVLIIAAALSVQDPRERPSAQAGTADQRHALFRGGEQDQKSEFIWYLNLWKAYDQVVQQESSSRQKAWCKQHFLSYMRMREWRDVHSQLHSLAAEHTWKENERPAHYAELHKALLTGLLGHLGCKIEEDSNHNYQGARGIKFVPHPGSSLAKKAGKWVMAAELVETSRLFARCLAKIEVQWLEEVGEHLLRRHISEPHWSKSSGAVRAWERGTLYGVTLYAKRGVSYRAIDPVLCRQLLIQQGLVAGEIEESALRRMEFLKHNQRLVREIEALEHKSRRPDVLVDDTLIEAFYDQIIPAEVLDLASFEKWRRDAEKAQPKLLYLTRDALMRHDADGITTERFPAKMTVFGQDLKLTYLHAPGESNDGVTLTVPLALLNQIPQNRCEWLVPGLLEAKVEALLRTVPQKHRHRLQPVAESAQAFMDAFENAEFDTEAPLLKAVQYFVEDRVQLKLPLESFRLENLAPHHSMNFCVLNEFGRVLAQSRNLNELRARFKQDIQTYFEQARIKLQTEDIQPSASVAQKKVESASTPASPSATEARYTQWTFGEIPELLELDVAGRSVVGFAALFDEGDAVSLRPFDTPEEAARVHRTGLTRLFALNLKEQVRALEKTAGLRELALQFINLGTEAELKAQLVAATLARTCLMPPLPLNATEFQTRLNEAKPRITLVGQELVRLVGQVLAERLSLEKRLNNIKAFPDVLADIQSQLAQLFPKQFLLTVPFEHLSHYPRYLKAISLRLDKLREQPARDAQLMQDWKNLAQPFEREYLLRLKAGVEDENLQNFRWLLEELRVSLFAQTLKTPMPVSVKRLQKIWDSRPR